MNGTHRFDWSELAFGSKKPLKRLDATFIVAPREMSQKRFKQLIKTYLPHGNIVLGVAKEDYVDGLEGQPQFRMLRLDSVSDIIDQVNRSQGKYSIYTLTYFQRELAYILEKIPFRLVALVNGSWRRAFHLSKPYYVMAEQGIRFEYVSPFSSQSEARAYESTVITEIESSVDIPECGVELSSQHIMNTAKQTASYSFDHTFQVGLALGRKTETEDMYTFLDATFNRVIPWQTYVLHNGSSREKYVTPPQDLNHYDTVHAEVEMLIRAQHFGVDLANTTIFINVMPCPACARMLTRLDVTEVVYELDHSDGYAVSLLEKAGKNVRRVTPT